MRWLEVRRHAPTKKGRQRSRGSHLSADGVALARAVGDEIGPFALVVTSASPRAIETAIAMGWAVDYTVEMPSGYVEVEHHEQWGWAQPYVRYAELVAGDGKLAAVAEVHRGIWREAVSAVEEGKGALVVSHGGAIEPALVSCLPDARHASWGAPFSHLDGVRLEFEGGRFTRARFLRCVRRGGGFPGRRWRVGARRSGRGPGKPG
jgi:broad specificity phosphatase PhoE